MKPFIMQDSSSQLKNIWLNLAVCYSYRESLSYLLSNFSLLTVCHRLKNQFFRGKKKIPTGLDCSNFVCWSRNSVWVLLIQNKCVLQKNPLHFYTSWSVVREHLPYPLKKLTSILCCDLFFKKWDNLQSSAIQFCFVLMLKYHHKKLWYK